VGLSVAIAMAHIPYGEGRRGFSLALGLTIAGLVTQCYVLLGWIFFRAQSLADMMLIWSRILDPALYNAYQSHILAEQIPVMIVAMVFLALEFIQRKRSHLLDVDWLSSRWRFPVYCSALLSILLLGSGTKTEFIYFRF
jgi:hypothetical protein